MKVSEQWLREWVNPPVTTDELAKQLTMAGLEVDSVSPVAGTFSGVIVAKVVSTTPHPQADKLTLCVVETGGDAPLAIVCGAANVRGGLMVALATIGASLPGGFVIKEAKLRGELSQGMLCSAAELGLQESAEGIIELPEDAPIGMDIREYLMLNDQVFDIDLTPNRADCFSMLGIAREVAALNHMTLNERPNACSKPNFDDTRPIRLQAEEACPHYFGRSIRGLNPHATTPLWVSERLRRAGIRPIHPVVDVTNYVMIELGQPMHAFNEAQLHGEIQVRLSRDGETLTLLNDQVVTLQKPTLIIADEKRPLAIAGVMGGIDSSVNEETTDIFLESAFFTPQAVTGVARQYGLCTDSSQRFERGVDPSIQRLAIERATDLIVTIAGGQVGPIICAQVTEKHLLPTVVNFDPVLVERLTGVAVAESFMLNTLQGLGLSVDSSTHPWTVTIPLHRYDITQDVDIVEEIIRLHGYDKLSIPAVNETLQSGVVHCQEIRAKQMGHFFCHRGYHEIISYSFVDPEIQQLIIPEQQAMTLLNPISAELSQMRLSLWPGLLASLIHNSHRQQALIKLFEIGVIFEQQDGLLQERPCIAGLISGELGGLNWSESTRKLDFYDLKGDLQALFSELCLPEVEFVAQSHPALHPGQSAQITFNNIVIGRIGVLHPQFNEAFDINEDVVLFELWLELPEKTVPRYQKISKYPSVRRDLSFFIGDNINAAQIEQAVRKVVSAERLKAFDVFDVYIGKSIPAGKKSMAIALTLQDDDRTLVDIEVNALIDNVINTLNNDFAITLRD